MKEGVGVLEQVKEQELAELKETTVENMWLLGSKLFRGIMELNQLFFFGIIISYIVFFHVL